MFVCGRNIYDGKSWLYDGLKCLEKTCFEQKIVAVEEMAFASN